MQSEASETIDVVNPVSVFFWGIVFCVLIVKFGLLGE